MITALKLHPDSPPAAVEAIEAGAVRRKGGLLELHYRLVGELERVSLPPAAAPVFTDGLWQATCLEAFVRAEGDDGYLELNFAPSRQWAAYRFSGRREGMARAEGLGAPAIEMRRTADAFELEARVELGRMGALEAEPWRLGLSAVICETDGRTSYWALRHPPGRPDFHHPDCFALVLPAPDRP